MEQHLKTQPYNITLKDPLKTSSLGQVGSFIATFYSEFRINLEKYLTYCSDIILWEKNPLKNKKRGGVCGTTEVEAHYQNAFLADSRFQLPPLAPLTVIKIKTVCAQRRQPLHLLICSALRAIIFFGITNNQDN